MRQITLTGNIGRNAATVDIGGKLYIRFPIANQERKDGPVLWADVLLRKRDGGEDRLTGLLRTGAKVLVQGAPSLSAYADRDGRAQASLSVWANMVDVVKYAPQEQDAQQETQQEAKPAATGVETNDDLPF